MYQFVFVAATEDSHGNYLPLSHVHFYSMSQTAHCGPERPPAQHRPGHCCRHQHSSQMMVIHNHQSFSLSLGNSGRYLPRAHFSGPPSYEEAVACGGCSALPTVLEQVCVLPRRFVGFRKKNLLPKNKGMSF